MRAALAQDQIAEAIQQIRALLDPRQVTMPAALSHLLEEAVRLWEDGPPAESHARLQQAAELARGMGYL